MFDIEQMHIAVGRTNTHTPPAAMPVGFDHSALFALNIALKLRVAINTKSKLIS
jgi:hypothetical protein